jgi:hypothetical protein
MIGQDKSESVVRNLLDYEGSGAASASKVLDPNESTNESHEESKNI